MNYKIVKLECMTEDGDCPYNYQSTNGFVQLGDILNAINVDAGRYILIYEASNGVIETFTTFNTNYYKIVDVVFDPKSPNETVINEPMIETPAPMMSLKQMLGDNISEIRFK